MRSIIIIFACLLSLCSTGRADELVNALQSGKVTARFVSNGHGSGASVDLIVAKTSTAPAGRYSISITPGIILNSKNILHPDLVVSGVGYRSNMFQEGVGRDEDIVLTSQTAKRIPLWVYSTDASKESAANGFEYAIGTKDHGLAMLLRQARDEKKFLYLVQVAVWIHKTDALQYEDLPFPFRRSSWYEAHALVEAAKEREMTPKASRIQFVTGRPVELKGVSWFWELHRYASAGEGNTADNQLQPNNTEVTPDTGIDHEIDALASNRNTLPIPPVSSTSETGNIWNGVLVKNQTQYTLRVLYSGPVKKTVSIAPGSTMRMNIPPGKYRVGVKALSERVIGLYGEVNYNPSSHPIHTYFIRRSR